MQVLYEAGFTNIGKEFTDEQTYLFGGRVGSLDHVLASESLVGDVTDADIWNINSVESIGLEYSRYNANVTDLYAEGPFRSSDHDPLVMGLNRTTDDDEPTQEPTEDPTDEPTEEPTDDPSASPTPTKDPGDDEDSGDDDGGQDNDDRDDGDRDQGGRDEGDRDGGIPDNGRGQDEDRSDRGGDRRGRIVDPSTGNGREGGRSSGPGAGSDWVPQSQGRPDYSDPVPQPPGVEGDSAITPDGAVPTADPTDGVEQEDVLANESGEASGGFPWPVIALVGVGAAAIGFVLFMARRTRP